MSRTPGVANINKGLHCITQVAIISHRAGLSHLGLQPGAMVGLFSNNNTEWVVAEHACYMYGLTTVPLYDTLGVDAVEHIIGATETTLIFATCDHASLLIDNASKLGSLKTIVLMDTPTEEIVKKSSDAGINAICFKDLEKTGSDYPSEKAVLSGETIATICYTSGTTGLPKGVVLSHANLLSFVATTETYGKNGMIPQLFPTDVYCSYLPLAHIFERIILASLTYVGARIGFFQGDTLKLMEDLSELKPTLFASVPRLYNKIFDKIRSGIKAKGAFATALFEKGYGSKKDFLKKGYKSHLLWDNILFNKIKAKLGGNVRFMLSGAAPIAAEVIEFMRICFGVDFVEGYGQTETSGAAVTVTFFKL